jgi:hypothetical protein
MHVHARSLTRPLLVVMTRMRCITRVGHWIEPALEKYGGAEKLQAIKRAIDANP